MLLPRHEEAEGEAEDPRRDLVQQLLEYRKFKEAASRLEEREAVQRMMFPRPKPSTDGMEPVVVEPEGQQMDVTKLLTAFQQVLERIDKLKLYQIVGEDISIEERIDFVLHEITNRGQMSFMDLFRNERRRMVMVVTFFALLELIRLGRVRIRQDELFGEITIYHAGGPTTAPLPAPGA
jgi:segregation and condensation protein A